MIDLDIELFDQLTIDSFNHLTNGVESLANGWWRLDGLVAAGQSHAAEAIGFEQLPCQVSTDIGFVAKDGQVGLFGQQFSAHPQISGTGGSQLQIQDDTPRLTSQCSLKPKKVIFLLATRPKSAP